MSLILVTLAFNYNSILDWQSIERIGLCKPKQPKHIWSVRTIRQKTSRSENIYYDAYPETAVCKMKISNKTDKQTLGVISSVVEPEPN